ncbi:type I iterative PKS [Penicillium taxi]|uniref:type I iterative PKS n=1 Tax=Penicillium taxi TaxID=168475 RepID=UPI002545094E|nr:type I iterative PKS [Penicillium taxi]KAJ5887882.1 type I iterative PKS [Penicillium taxi]
MGEFVSDSITHRVPLQSDVVARLGGEETQPYQDDMDIEDTPVPFPIAIVGMAMRLPGGVSCETEFWDFLINKRDGLCKVPDTRYNIDAFYDDSRPGKIRTKHGYFLKHNIRHFDPDFFGISKIEAAKLDPQQRMLLEVIWECMENGGQVGWRGKNIGCYVGVFGEDWLDVKIRDPQDHDRYRVVGTGSYALSNRISYEYDLGGPSLTIQTACSSSLVGLHEACQALYSGECSSALVAGTNLIFTPTMTTSMSDNLVISKSGVCRTFDAAADGYGRGEAVNAIFIKPLDKAIRDGDPIRAVIRSSATNCDGKTPSITTPGSAAQERLIKRAYRKAGLDVSSTGLFECHGTGTTVGDLAETSVVGKIFGDKGIHIGAVKPNVGHSEGASGITSVIHSVLALENRTIPPSVHFQNPNPSIPFEQAKLKVAVEPTPWPKDRSERISINSFGIGGTNAHVILDSAPSKRTNVSTDVDSPQLLVVSAKSKDSLDGQIKRLQAYLETTTSPLADIAYTLGLRREHLPHRAFLVTQSDGKVSSFERSTSMCAPIIFTFTGQGAQWPGMGRQLIKNVQGFRKDIQMMDRVLQMLKSKPLWSIEDELLKCDEQSRVAEAEFAQPLCTAVQIALVNVLQTWGITPDAVLGHSSGEIAAGYASGALSAEIAILIAYFRGQAMKNQSNHSGGMAAVGLGFEKVEPFLKPGVVIGCYNSPDSVTLSGDSETLIEVLDNIRGDNQDTFCRKLAVNVAYHSHHMVEAGEAYEKMISPHLSHQPSMIPMYSTVSGTIISDPSILSPSYWRRNLQSPVLFHTAIERILNDDSQPKLFLEIGPHSALSGPIRQSIKNANTQVHRYTPTIIREKEPWRSLMTTVGNLHTHGASINLRSVIPQGTVLTELPPYSWQHNEDYWEEPRIVHDWRNRQYPHHELLGSHTLESNQLEPSWRNILKLENVLWLMDHKLGTDIVFPAAGYVAMAGEAVRRVTGSSDYSLRNMFIRNALVLEDFTEIMTNLRPEKITDHADSMWFDFTISTFQTGKWKKHVVGQVRGGPDQEHEHDVPPRETHSRKVDSENWYRALKKRGLDYGPHFRGLKQITASATTQQASAVLHSDEPPHDSYYALHPTSIDQCLQLLSAAATQGISRRITRMCIPTAIESLYVSEGRGPMDLNVSCETIGGTMEAHATLFSNNRVSLLMERGFFFSIQDPESDDMNTLLASNLHWMPHIDYLPPKEQLPPHEPVFNGQTMAKLTSVCVAEAYRLTRHSTPTSKHLEKYHVWLKDLYQKIQEKSTDIVPEMREEDVSVLSIFSPYADALNKEAHASHPMFKPTLELLKRVCFGLHDVLEGRINPLELLMQNDGMKNLFDNMSAAAPCEDFLALLGQSNPAVRILEIGAGTGGLTSIALKSLNPDSGRLYSRYKFTDISPGFIADAQERFHQYDAVEYATLDITRDPEEQSYVPESYDLILAGNVLHATPQISSTLQNVRKLLAPGGRLLMQELSGDLPSINFLMGILPGWWLGGNDGRPDSPALSVERWHEELIEANFTGVEAVRYANDRPLSLVAVLLSRTKAADVDVTGGQIGLIYYSQITEWGRDLEKALSFAGYTVKWYTLQETPSAGTDLISLLDLEEPFFQYLSADEFVLFQNCISKLAECHLLWITKSLQIACDDPSFALVLGVARTLRHELSVKFATIEIDQFDTIATTSVLKVFQHLKVQSHRSWLDPDYEYALQDGKVLLPRFQWSSLDQQLASVPHLSAARSLDIKFNGIFDSLTWAISMSPVSPPDLKEGEVEIDMKYVGMNFRDMMITMGFLGSTDQLGFEGSGTVRRVGSSVEHLRVGDKVSCIYDGLFATRVIVPAFLCEPIPEGTSLEDAAAFTVIFATAIYCMIIVGDLKKGQSVLIHSACGGVGLAAIQVCRMIGAEIYVTVGTNEKVRYLTNVIKIPACRIFDSRSTSFLQGVLRETNGRGVDLVLNSLAGELLHASWRCVAKFGKMVEIGKRDFLGHGKLDMRAFLEHRSFCGVDLRMLSLEFPMVLRDLLDRFMDYFRQGKLTRIEPVTVFEARDVIKAFRYMQTGQHMGKVVVRMPEDPESLPITGIHSSVSIFRPDVSYLLIGGLGGLGRAISTWMVEKGARNFIFLSRSGAESLHTQAFIQDLENQGMVSVTVVTGDVAVEADLHRAISAAKCPIAGVFQMAMVLKDQMFSKMTHEEWTAALKPKVQGTWNLHYNFQSTPLDFFVLVSSVTGVMGFGSQTNYAAANTFLDSFVKYRHSHKLPASVLDLGFMGDIGYAAEKSPQALKVFNTLDGQILEERHLLQALEISIFSQFSHPSSQLIVGMGTRSLGTNSLVQEGRFIRWRNVAVSGKATTVTRSHALSSLLDEIRDNPELLNDEATHDKITVELGKVVASHLAYAEDMSKEELANIAIDSLMGIEIRSWLRRNTGIDISLVEIANAGTVGGLADVAVKILRKKYLDGEENPSTSTQPSSEEPDELAVCLEDMKLGINLRPIAGTIPDWCSDSEGRIFLTGATGFVGAFFLQDLLALPHVKNVTCLVRTTDPESGKRRIENTFARYSLPMNFLSKVTVVPGNIAYPNLGMSKEDFDHHAQASSAAFHIAAHVNYTLPYSAHREGNITGLLNVLKFVNAGRLKALHYWSSISACGIPFLSGGAIPEDKRAVLDRQSFDLHTGYTRSKLVAESIVWNAIGNGFPISIYRPGFVMGDSVTGVDKPEDLTSRLMINCIQLGAFPTSPPQLTHFVPVDYLCAAILHISQSSKSHGHAFNVLYPQDESITFADTFNIISDCCPTPLQEISASKWLQLFREGGKKGMKVATPMLQESLADSLIWWDTSNGMSTYETTNLRKALADSPETSNFKSMPDLLKTYYNHWKITAVEESGGTV